MIVVRSGSLILVSVLLPHILMPPERDVSFCNSISSISFEADDIVRLS